MKTIVKLAEKNWNCTIRLLMFDSILMDLKKQTILAILLLCCILLMQNVNKQRRRPPAAILAPSKVKPLKTMEKVQ